MQNTAAVMMSSPPRADRRCRKPCGKRAHHAEHGHANTGRFPQRQRLDTEQRRHHHGVQRQCGQGKARARRGRKADRDVIEDEEQSEEGEPQKRDRRPVPPRRPSHFQEKRRREQANKADAPPQDRE
jgi:hypothetical protein